MEQIFRIHVTAFVIFSDFLHGIIRDGHCIGGTDGNTVSAVEAVAGNDSFFILQAQYAKEAVLYAHTAADTFVLIDGYHKHHSFSLCFQHIISGTGSK